MQHGRSRWAVLALAWIVIAALALVDAFAVRSYLSMLDESALLPADRLPLTHVTPSEYADTRTWVRFALDSSGQLRIRHTHIDNAPAGREVHWSSGLERLIAVAGRVNGALTGRAKAQAIEQSLVWFNLPLLLAAIIAFSTWIALRLGTSAGVLMSFTMAGHRWFYDGFAPAYVDHHGILTAACFGVVLGVLFAGAGWIRSSDASTSRLTPTGSQARRAMIVSAVCGGLGMWVGAASVIPTILFVGVAGLLVAWLLGDSVRREGVELDGDLWRLWGRVGFGVALLAYIGEYAPSHFAMRLEVNHPLYALAWLGGGELVALLVDTRVSSRRAPAWRWAAAAVAVLAPAIVIAIWRGRVFAPIDPAVARLHERIGEFQSIRGFVDEIGDGAIWRLVPGFALLLTAVTLFWARGIERMLIAFTATVALPLVVMACWQTRWWLTASGAELSLLVAAVVAIGSQRSARTRWILSLVVSAFFVEQFVERISITRRNVNDRSVSVADALQPMYRDAAVALRASSPDSTIVLLSSPNASNSIGYFGGFETLASFYWENIAGVEAAAAIFSARTDDEARALIAARGITHIAIVSMDDFLAEYLKIARPDAGRDALANTFGHRLLVGDDTASWLRAIPFRPRLPKDGEHVSLFQVVADQTPFDAAWSRAIAEAAADRPAEAERAFSRAIALRDSSQRATLLAAAGRSAYQWRQHALAVRLLSASNAVQPSVDVEVNIAWILATSADDGVRDGASALRIAQSLARRRPNDVGILDVLAAALAENGRFEEAVALETQLESAARAAGDSAGVARATARRAAYAAGQPWRQ